MSILSCPIIGQSHCQESSLNVYTDIHSECAVRVTFPRTFPVLLQLGLEISLWSTYQAGCSTHQQIGHTLSLRNPLAHHRYHKSHRWIILLWTMTEQTFTCEKWTRNDVRWSGKGKGTAVPLQAWSGPEGSRKLRFPDFMTTAQDGGKVVSLMHRPPLPAGNAPGTHLC